MITYKFKIQNKIDIGNYIREYNSVYRFVYNRYQENKNYKLSEIESLIKTRMNNITHIDLSIIRGAICQNQALKDTPKIIFGGKDIFRKRSEKKITKEEYKKEKQIPIFLRGSSSDPTGNRKASLNIIENNSILLKMNKKDHQVIQLPKMNKRLKDKLEILQKLCEDHKTYFSLLINEEYVWFQFDEFILKEEKERRIKKDRIMTFDLNPNYIGLIIADYKTEEEKEIIYKEIIDITKINKLKQDKYQTNKRRHEIFEISKHIINLAKHYEVEEIAFEKLSIFSKEHKKGTRFNKLINNQWLRTPFLNNIKKRCHIEGISYQEIMPQYSSFIGQMMNEGEVDSIAAAIELSRRSYMFKRIYKDKTLVKQDIIYPMFNVDLLSNHWKKEIIDRGEILNNIKSWIDLYQVIKKFKISYRFLFSLDKFKGISLRLNSVKSYVNLHIFTRFI